MIRTSSRRTLSRNTCERVLRPSGTFFFFLQGDDERKTLLSITFDQLLNEFVDCKSTLVFEGRTEQQRETGLLLLNDPDEL